MIMVRRWPLTVIANTAEPVAYDKRGFSFVLALAAVGSVFESRKKCRCIESGATTPTNSRRVTGFGLKANWQMCRRRRDQRNGRSEPSLCSSHPSGRHWRRCRITASGAFVALPFDPWSDKSATITPKAGPAGCSDSKTPSQDSTCRGRHTLRPLPEKFGAADRTACHSSAIGTVHHNCLDEWMDYRED